MAAGAVTLAGKASRPAWPTSCCSSAVALRIPACISERFDWRVFNALMSIVPRIISAETIMRMPTDTSSSTSVKPASLRRGCGEVVVGVTAGSSERVRLQRGNGRARHHAVAALRGHADGRGHGDALQALLRRRHGQWTIHEIRRADFLDAPDALVIPAGRRHAADRWNQRSLHGQVVDVAVR